MTKEKSAGFPLSERLRVARETAGLTQAQVAKMLQLHRPSISEIEAGRRKVSAEELTKLADLYGVSLDWLASTDDGPDNKVQAKVELAARELSKLKPEDLDRVVRLLASLRQS